MIGSKHFYVVSVDINDTKLSSYHLKVHLIQHQVHFNQYISLLLSILCHRSIFQTIIECTSTSTHKWRWTIIKHNIPLKIIITRNMHLIPLSRTAYFRHSSYCNCNLLPYWNSNNSWVREEEIGCLSGEVKLHCTSCKRKVKSAWTWW